jgi:predicted  nucleic acid-binding Zn-ribbon protein
MNEPRNQNRRDNLITDLTQKRTFLKRREANLLQEIENVNQKIKRLEEAKDLFHQRLEELRTLQDLNEKDLRSLEEMTFEKSQQLTGEDGLSRLYRERPHLNGVPKEEIPPATLAEYGL